MSTFQDTNAEAIRTWARANGFIVDEQGRVPAAIREAHQLATDA
ncbi:Lsr2 family protein [Streptomyces lunaelactis]|nr:Lsr2 family protein [Streptomyces lunaelactis]NUK80876.1 Lsr2 family protein [Streptomyces lunaelactis]